MKACFHSLRALPRVKVLLSRGFPRGTSRGTEVGQSREACRAAPSERAVGALEKHSRAETFAIPSFFSAQADPALWLQEAESCRSDFNLLLPRLSIMRPPVSQAVFPPFTGCLSRPYCFGHRLRSETPQSRPKMPLTHACRFVWLMPQTAGEAFLKICLRTLLR